MRRWFAVVQKLQMQFGKAHFERHAFGKGLGGKSRLCSAVIEIDTALGIAARHVTASHAGEPLDDVESLFVGPLELDKFIAGRITLGLFAGEDVPIRRICHSGYLFSSRRRRSASGSP